MKNLISETIYININNKDIEGFLTDKYGSIVRWAIVEVTDSQLKISFTYEHKKKDE